MIDKHDEASDDYFRRRFQENDKGQLIDTMIDPSVLAAQEEYERKSKGKVARPKTTGFSQPSADDLRRAKEES